MNYSYEQINEVVIGKQRNDGSGEEQEYGTPRGFEFTQERGETGNRLKDTPTGRGSRRGGRGRGRGLKQRSLSESFAKDIKEGGKRKERSPAEDEAKKREKVEEGEERSPFEKSNLTLRTPPKKGNEKEIEDREMEKLQETLNNICEGMKEERNERKRMMEKWEEKWKENEERIKEALEEFKKKMEQEREERIEMGKRAEKAAEEEGKRREQLKEEMLEKIKNLEERFEERMPERSREGPEQDRREKSAEEEEREKRQMEELEWRIEEGERERKRNNVVISGIRGEGWDKDKLKSWVRDKLRIEIEFKRVWTIRGRANSKIGAQCKDGEEKEKLMGMKSALKGTDVFIDHDTTWRERRTREKLNELAKQWKREGHTRGRDSFFEERQEKGQRTEEQKDNTREETNESIKVVSWNVAGIKGLGEEGWRYLKVFDVICLQETWMEDGEGDKIKKRLKGYEIEVREANGVLGD
ncbi:golgin subfamily A member 6-like protein 6 [Nasonia vitripennis]|uniref:Trichohyalin-like n=1 Tax=Nasonia vitripennis TaxID=7425 RepID=A0A7M7H8K5_NASVI|nr:golgin subfamily A member 6-like protein 6 [Nasonia vitripennis]